MPVSCNKGKNQRTHESVKTTFGCHLKEKTPMTRQKYANYTSPCERSLALSPEICFIIPGGPHTCTSRERISYMKGSRWARSYNFYSIIVYRDTLYQLDPFCLLV